jgi:2,4-didehydro-3-deoxy-L-rhamnonate hydrolase
MPRGGEKLDYEVELAAIMGKEASYVTPEDAPKYVAG